MAVKKEKFPGNSNVEKEERLKTVTKAKRVKKNQPLLVRLFAGETTRQIANYVLWDVVVPAAKSTIQDIITNALDMALYNEPDRLGTGRRPVRRDRDRSFISYDRVRANKVSRPTHKKGRNSFDDLIIDSRGEAEEVLTVLTETIDLYGATSVADLYDTVGIDSEFTDNKWGWYNLSRAGVKRGRYGYYLDLPIPEPLD